MILFLYFISIKHSIHDRFVCLIQIRFSGTRLICWSQGCSLPGLLSYGSHLLSTENLYALQSLKPMAVRAQRSRAHQIHHSSSTGHESHRELELILM